MGAAFGRVIANGFQQPERADRHHIRGVFGLIETYAHVGLRRQVVNLVRLRLRQDVAEAGPVGHVSIVQKERDATFVRIRVDGIEAVGIESGGAAYDAVNLVAFGQQQFREKRAILSGNSGNKSLFHR